MAKMTELELALRNVEITSRRAAEAALGKGDNHKLLLHTPKSGHALVCEPEVSRREEHLPVHDRFLVQYSIKWRLTIYKHTYTRRSVTEKVVYNQFDIDTLAEAVAMAREWVLDNLGSDELQIETLPGMFKPYTKH